MFKIWATDVKTSLHTISERKNVQNIWNIQNIIFIIILIILIIDEKIIFDIGPIFLIIYKNMNLSKYSQSAYGISAVTNNVYKVY